VIVDVITIFPRMIEAALTEGVVGRAREAGVIEVRAWDLRDFTEDRHRTVDDVAYGGGPGMVMKPAPIFAAVEAIGRERGTPDAVVLMTPQGRPFSHDEAERLSKMDRVVIICGRYEGVDERVAEGLVTDEVSIGDYVLTGGELPALVVVDAVTRLVPGVVGDSASIVEDSFVSGLLDYPHYTRPADFAGRTVPDVLLSGHHGEIERWRRRERVRRTATRRPDLIERARLTAEDRHELERWRAESADVKEKGDEGD
jgi:tRNA (guanine37-N1)-methyltransferase